MNAQAQAIAQVESIVALVAALEVDYDRLEELRSDIEHLDYEQEELKGEWYGVSELDAPAEFLEWEKLNGKSLDEMRAELAELEAQAGDCADQDEAQERIQEDPLSVEVRSGWVSLGDPMGAEEFRIVLCTGGPHVELVGDLRNGSPSSVRVLYQGWDESGELSKFDHDAVLTYCRQFCFEC